LIKNYYRSYARSKFRYVKRMLRHRLRGQPRVCPYCGPESPLSRVCRKKLVVDILKCDTCRLTFRWPLDSPEELEVHYENEFAEESPQVRLPGPDELRALRDSDFRSLHGGFRDQLRVLRAVKPAGRVLDYGCSWGYVTYLFRKEGYDAVGFDVSRTRAAYGREHLAVSVIDSLSELESLHEESFDVVYSNNVLEHLASIGKALALCGKLLRDRGVAFHVLPNFTGKTARSGNKWLSWIGEDHPVAPTMEFFERALPAAGLKRFQFATSPFDDEVIAAVSGRPGTHLQLEGDELLILAWKGAA